MILLEGIQNKGNILMLNYKQIETNGIEIIQFEF